MITSEKLTDSSWHAELSLVYKTNNVKTIISSRKHKGPLVVQKPFYPEEEVCHTYILHPPGGVVGGDKLTINVSVEHGAHSLITTPASGKFYRCDHRHAQQNQNLKVADGILEWFPQETILFDQAKVRTHTSVALDAKAKFAGWEILCLGRPASNESFKQGYCHQNFEIIREGKKVLIERARLEGGSELLNSKWGMQSHTVMGVMVVTNANAEILSKARDVEPLQSGLGSATLIDNVLICRCLADQGIEAREYFTRVWQAVRPAWINKHAVQPRIWHT